MSNLLSNPKWTNKQKEVWKNVEAYTNLVMKGNMKRFLEYFHKDYSSWNYNELMPISKNDIKNELLDFPKHKIDKYNIVPVKISIFNDVAIVHYYYSAVYIDTDGKEKSKQGCNTDILLKRKDKWILIGDNMGPFRK